MKNYQKKTAFIYKILHLITKEPHKKMGEMIKSDDLEELAISFHK